MSQDTVNTTLKVGDRVHCTQGTNAGQIGVVDQVLSTATGWGGMTPQQFPLVRVYVPEPDGPAWQFSHWAHAFEVLPPLPEPGDPYDEVEDGTDADEAPVQGATAVPAI